MLFTCLVYSPMTLREHIEKELRSGLSQRTLAQKIGVSHGTVNNILAGIVPSSTKTLEKFSQYFHVSVDALLPGHTMAHDSETKAVYQSDLSPALKRLIGIAKDLDIDELATLQRCAETFRAEEPEVRQHLIGQLKLVERLVKGEQAAALLHPKKQPHKKGA